MQVTKYINTVNVVFETPNNQTFDFFELNLDCPVAWGGQLGGNRTIKQRRKNAADKYRTWLSCQPHRGHLHTSELHRSLRVPGWLLWAKHHRGKKRVPARTRQGGLRSRSQRAMANSQERDRGRLPTRLSSSLQQPETGPSPGARRLRGEGEPWAGSRPRRRPARRGHSPAPRAMQTLTRAAGAPPFPRQRGGRRPNLPPPDPTATSASRASFLADVTSSNNSGRQSCPGRSRGGGGGLGLPAEAPSLGLSACPRRRARAAPPDRRGPRTEAGCARRGGGCSRAGTGRGPRVPRRGAGGRAARPIGSRGSGSGPMGPGGGTRRAAIAGARQRGRRCPGQVPALLCAGRSWEEGGAAAELLGTRCDFGQLRPSAPPGGSGPAGRAVPPAASSVARSQD